MSAQPQGNAPAVAHGAAGGIAARAGGAAAEDSDDAAIINDMLSGYLLLVLGCISAALVIWRLSTGLSRYIRHVSCLTNDTQTYFARAGSKWSWFKKNVQYSPIFSKRHNREFQLSSAINVGTLPTRLQLVFLLGYFSTNVAFCVMGIDFSKPVGASATVFINRTGTLAVANMIPLFLMAGRNNPLLYLLGISFDTFNLLHRWLGRIVALEALAHTLGYLYRTAATKGWSVAFDGIFKSDFLIYGFVATASFVVIAIQASSVFRHAFYEIFKILHICLAIASVVGLYYHLGPKGFPQIKYLYPVMVLWAFDRTARFLRVAYYNFGSGGGKALVEALPGGSTRVTVTMARPWFFKPSQHAYLYFPSVSLWQSHPFSVAWSEEADSPSGEKLPVDRRDILAMKKTTVSFILRGRTGMTGNLYEKAASCIDGKMVTRCLVEGPYGGMHQMHSYGTVMLFAGGVGITQAVPHVRDLVIAYSNGMAATRKVILVWTIQSPEHLEWIRPWMTEVLGMEKRREVLRIMLFVSRPRSTKEIHSPSSTVQMFPGRPNIDTLLAREMEDQVGHMGVSVCGPGALSDEVRRAVRNKQYNGAIDFVEEAFSW